MDSLIFSRELLCNIWHAVCFLKITWVPFGGNKSHARELRFRVVC